MGSVGEYKHFGDQEVRVDVQIVGRSGYYAGCNLDWNISFNLGESDEDFLPEISEIADVFRYHSDMNAGLCTIQARKAENWLETKKEELIDKVEKVFTDRTTPLRCTGVASNGEAFYEKA